MNKLRYLAIFLIFFAIGFTFSSCGHHHKHHRISGDVATVDSSNITIVIQQPPPYNQDVLVQELLDEIREFETNQQILLDLIVEILNDEEECKAWVVNGKLKVAPGQLKHIPSLYHVLCEHYGVNCNPALCDEFPKPCSNEAQ
jgi:hypothetical protein